MSIDFKPPSFERFWDTVKDEMSREELARRAYEWGLLHAAFSYGTAAGTLTKQLQDEIARLQATNSIPVGQQAAPKKATARMIMAGSLLFNTEHCGAGKIYAAMIEEWNREQAEEKKT